MPLSRRTSKRATNPIKTNRSEARYASNLRSIAERVGALISGTPDPNKLEKKLDRYSTQLIPWARDVAGRMIDEVNVADLIFWRKHAKQMSIEMRRDLFSSSHVGAMMCTLLARQVKLIKSIPIEAGQRVHKLTQLGLVDSRRASEIAREIERSEEVTASRATLIARTEVSRTASMLMRTRALDAGLTHYIWKTANDSTVRPGHRAMQGRVIDWNKEPAVKEDNGIMHFHAGCVWNCRCWPEPIITE